MKKRIEFDFSKWGQEWISVTIHSEDIIILHQNPINNNWFYGVYKNGMNFVCLDTDLEMYQETKPREIWVNEYKDGYTTSHQTKENALRLAGADCLRTIKFREVEDGEQ